VFDQPVLKGILRLEIVTGALVLHCFCLVSAAELLASLCICQPVCLLAGLHSDKL